MKPYDFDFDSWQEILDTLEQAGMTDYEAYPEVYFAWTVTKDTDDYSLLDELLTRDPWIITEAKKRIKECPFFQPKREEIHKIQGRFNLGLVVPYQDLHVGLNQLDFIRGLFIFGETGSGKTYPVLRICDQMLSIPKRIPTIQ